MTSSRRHPQLESLRGLAALAVFAGHFIAAFMPRWHGYRPGGMPDGEWMASPFFFAINGSAAVSLFFVLSGFVLAIGLLQDTERSIAGAVVRRWPRLMPIALFSVLLSCALVQLGLYRHGEAAARTGSHWMASFGLSARSDLAGTRWLDAFLQGSFLVFFRSSADAWLNTSLWTMHLELVGSLIVFGLVGVVRRATTGMAMAVFGIVALLAFMGNAYLPLFVAGAALALVHQRQWAPPSMGHRPAVLLLVIALFALGYLDPGKGFYRLAQMAQPHEAAFRIACHGLASLALIHLSLVHPKTVALLSRPSLRTLGFISFPLYALHVPVMFSLSAGVFLLLVERMAAGPAMVLTLCATLGVLLPVCWMLGRWDRAWCRVIGADRVWPIWRKRWLSNNTSLQRRVTRLVHAVHRALHR